MRELPVPLRASSFEEWWMRTSALAGPLTGIPAALPDQSIQAITARVKHATDGCRTLTALEFPGLSLIATGRLR